MSAHKRIRWVGRLMSVVILLATAVIGFSLWDRSTDLDNHIYQVCVTNETQDAVIVAQLEAAKRRVMASLPLGSAESIYQLEVLNDGIAALEPPDEPDCNPPKGTVP